MLEADLDGNGTIEFPEFLELMKEKYGSDDQESDLRSDLISLRCCDTNLREAFKIFDRDRDGFIDMRELKKVSLIPVTFYSKVFLLSPFLNHVKIGNYPFTHPTESIRLLEYSVRKFQEICAPSMSLFVRLALHKSLLATLHDPYSIFGGFHDVGHLP